jgi:peptidoglycan/LPS O-acetylase OafA/YrhL
LACGYGSAITSSYYYSITDNSQNGNFLNSFYTNPFVRATPYLIGTYTGIAYKKYKTGEEKNFFNSLEKSLGASWFVCLLGLGIILFISYFPRTLQNYGSPWSQAFGYTWNVLDRPVYVMGLFFFLAPVLAGNLSWIKSVMSCGFFNLMAKLTFCAYLIHVMVVAFIYYGADQFADLATTSMVYNTLAALMITMVLAVFLHLMVEKPFGNLEGKLLNPRPKPKDISQERDELMQAKISVQDTN